MRFQSGLALLLAAPAALLAQADFTSGPPVPVSFSFPAAAVPFVIEPDVRTNDPAIGFARINDLVFGLRVADDDDEGFIEHYPGQFIASFFNASSTPYELEAGSYAMGVSGLVSAGAPLTGFDYVSGVLFEEDGQELDANLTDSFRVTFDGTAGTILVEVTKSVTLGAWLGAGVAGNFTTGSAIPEPRSVALVFGALAGGAVLWRRRAARRC